MARNLGGRPTSYTPELVEKAWAYVHGGWQECGDKVPTIAGLACETGVSRETCYDWATHEDKVFSDILMAIMQIQERELVNNGLNGKFTPTITKMMLTKHGYSDAIDNRLTTPDGSMAPKALDLSKLPADALKAIVEAADGQADNG